MSMNDRLDQEVTAWRPEPGDKIYGKVVDISENQGEYEPYPLLEIETADGAMVAVHAFHTVLKSELAKKRPSPGDSIGIKYLGKTAGKDYEGYRVIIDRAAPTPIDWGQQTETGTGAQTWTSDGSNKPAASRSESFEPF